MTTIFIDMDGVLCDFAGHLMARFGKEPSICCGEYWLPKVLGIGDHEWNPILNMPEFWETVPLMHDAHAIMDLCRETGKNIAVLTNYGDWPICMAAKENWISRHFPFLKNDLILARNKHHIAGYDKLLIDDFDDNVREWRRANGQGILIPRHWNSEHKLQDMALGLFKARLKGALL